MLDSDDARFWMIEATYWKERALGAESRMEQKCYCDPTDARLSLYVQICPGCNQRFYHECPGVDVNEQLARLKSLEK